MKLNGYNLKNNIQTPVQVKRNNVSNTINPTVPTQIEPRTVDGEISSAASNTVDNTSQTPVVDALKVGTLEPPLAPT